MMGVWHKLADCGFRYVHQVPDPFFDDWTAQLLSVHHDQREDAFIEVEMFRRIVRRAERTHPEVSFERVLDGLRWADVVAPDPAFRAAIAAMQRHRLAGAPDAISFAEAYERSHGGHEGLPRVFNDMPDEAEIVFRAMLRAVQTTTTAKAARQAAIRYGLNAASLDRIADTLARAFGRWRRQETT